MKDETKEATCINERMENVGNKNNICDLRINQPRNNVRHCSALSVFSVGEREEPPACPTLRPMITMTFFSLISLARVERHL
jgi:hypothetical protein